MSNVVDLLLKQAETIRASDLETTIRSSVSELMASGMEFEKAASLVEKEVESIQDSFIAQLLEKTAGYVDGLESKVAELQAKIDERTEVSPETADLHIKLASAGFSEEEIRLMDQAPSLLNKVASVAQEPWELGQGSGMQREKTDPLLEWIIS